MECHDWERSEKRMEICQNNSFQTHWVYSICVKMHGLSESFKNLPHRPQTVSINFHPWSLHTTVDYVGIKITNFKNQGFW